MAKKNCWEYKDCGRQQGGHKSEELGVCLASTDNRLDSIHGGLNAGRTCWMVAGTLCGGKAQGTFAQKFDNCIECEFYNRVKEEEASKFQMTVFLLKKLNDSG
jgi:hypothetical protein